jgi:hypothetical protein
MTPIKPRWRRLVIRTVVVAEVVALAWLLWPEVDAFRRQPAGRRELVALTSELRLGMSRADVQRRLTPARLMILSAREVGAAEVLIETPYRFGAGSWLAWLAFTDGRLSSVRIRTHDGRHMKPAGSPPDLGVAPPGP